MRKLLSLFALLGICGGMSAQKDSAWYKLGFGLNYRHLQDQSFIGPSGEITVLAFDKENSPHLGFGLRTGFLYDQIDEREELDFRLDLLYTEVDLNYNVAVTGALYLVPVEIFAMLGYEEDFLQAGAGLEWLQFSGEQSFDYHNTRNVYDVQDFTMLASLQFGYLHRPKDEGVMFRLVWKPVWNLEHRDMDYADSFLIGLGYSF